MSIRLECFKTSIKRVHLVISFYLDVFEWPTFHRHCNCAGLTLALLLYVKSGVPCNVIRLANLSELRSKLGKESGFVEMDLSSWHVDDSNARELHTKVTDATARANRAFYLAYNFRATRAFEGFFGVSFEGLLWCIWGSSFCNIYLHRHFSFLWKVLKGLKTFCWTITSECLFLAKKVKTVSAPDDSVCVGWNCKALVLLLLTGQLDMITRRRRLSNFETNSQKFCDFYSTGNLVRLHFTRTNWVMRRSSGWGVEAECGNMWPLSLAPGSLGLKTCPNSSKFIPKQKSFLPHTKLALTVS